MAKKKVVKKKDERSSKQKLIDELDALGIDFEEVKEIPRVDDAGDPVMEDGKQVIDYVEMTEAELVVLLKASKEDLKEKHNGEESKPELKEMPKKGDDQAKTKNALPPGTEVIAVTAKETMELQAQVPSRFVGYYEVDGQAYAIVKKRSVNE